MIHLLERTLLLSLRVRQLVIIVYTLDDYDVKIKVCCEIPVDTKDPQKIGTLRSQMLKSSGSATQSVSYDSPLDISW
jgi:hypothetical protein